MEREQFGAPIASYQLIQGMVADCAVDTAVNRASTHPVAWEAGRPQTDRKTLHGKAANAKVTKNCRRPVGRYAEFYPTVFEERGDKGRAGGGGWWRSSGVGPGDGVAAPGASAQVVARTT